MFRWFFTFCAVSLMCPLPLLADQWTRITKWPIAPICSDTNTMRVFFENENRRLQRCSGKPENVSIVSRSAEFNRNSRCLEVAGLPISCVSGGIADRLKTARLCIEFPASMALANAFCFARNGGSDLEGCHSNHQCATGYSHYEYENAWRNEKGDTRVCVNFIDDTRLVCRTGGSCDGLFGRIDFVLVEKELANSCN